MENSSRNQIYFLLGASSAFAIAMASARYFRGDEVDEPWLTAYTSKLESKPIVSKRCSDLLTTYNFDCIPSTMTAADAYLKHFPSLGSPVCFTAS